MKNIITFLLFCLLVEYSYSQVNFLNISAFEDTTIHKLNSPRIAASLGLISFIGGTTSSVIGLNNSDGPLPVIGLFSSILIGPSITSIIAGRSNSYKLRKIGGRLLIMSTSSMIMAASSDGEHLKGDNGLEAIVIFTNVGLLAHGLSEITNSSRYLSEKNKSKVTVQPISRVNIDTGKLTYGLRLSF